jgi:hypothetical protein
MFIIFNFEGMTEIADSSGAGTNAGVLNAGANGDISMGIGGTGNFAGAIASIMAGGSRHRPSSPERSSAAPWQISQPFAHRFT